MSAITTETVALRLAQKLITHGVAIDDPEAFAADFAPDLVDWVGGEEAVPVALASKVTSTATAWNTDVMQRIDWWTGPADGGPNGDGLYPMVNAAGVETMFPSLAKILDSTAKGNAGWSPKLTSEADGATRVVWRITDWIGGQGSKPATGYIAEDGSLVGTAAAAQDFFAAISGSLDGLKLSAEEAADLATVRASAALASAQDAAAAASTELAKTVQNDVNIEIGIDTDPTGLVSSPVGFVGDEEGFAPIIFNGDGGVVVKKLLTMLAQFARASMDGSSPYNYAGAITDEAENVAFGVEMLTGLVAAGFGFRVGDVAVRGDVNGYLVAIIKVSTGAVLAGVLDDGSIPAPETGFAFGQASLEVGEFNYQWGVVDEDDNPLIGVKNNQLLLPTGTLTAGSDLDAENVARSAAYKTRMINDVQRPTAAYNVWILYGQSLARGQETSPALSRTNRFGNLTLGRNVLSSTNDGANYVPFGAATFQPLAAYSVDGSTADTDPATAPAGSFGEPWNHGWVNFGKHLHNQAMFVENDTARLFVTYNPSVSGKTIEQLSKVNTQDATNRYSRFTDGLTKIVAAAGGSSVAVPGVMWGQGEYDYLVTWGSTKATKLLYKAALNTQITDMVTDIKAITGQTKDPAFFTYQTGASYTADVDSVGNPGLHVGMAQLEVSLERDRVWMVGPIYQYTDKGGHMTSNGSRWMGNQIAKVFHKVVHLGQDWSPLRPLRITQAFGAITIDFHVPEPPLVFDMPYVQTTATSYGNKGFRVTDDSGEVPISTPELVGRTRVKIALGRETVGAVHVWYASKTTYNGNGMLRDSDPTVGLDSYVYEPESGMAAGENIAALVGKPYPLHNWCVAFFLPVGYSEI